MPNLHHPPDMQALTTLVRDCSVSGVARRVLLLRTELLPPRLSQPHHLRLAREALEPLIGGDRACLYELAEDRLALSWRGDAEGRLDQAMARLDHLLGEASFDGPSMPELARLFDLPLHGAALLALASSPGRVTEASSVVNTPQPTPEATLVPLDGAMLDRLEPKLAQANLARFARRRTVCRLGARAFKPAWDSRFVSLPDLMAELTPGHDAFADPALLRRLSRLAERRLMALLASGPELRGARPFSIGLTVGAVLSPDFLRLDAALPPGLRGHALVELQPADVMADLPAYRFARAFVRARTFRVVLTDVTPLLLELLDLPVLDLDFVALPWSPALLGLDPALLRAGSARWVLTGADTAEAVGWGRALGIGLFQGQAALPGAGHRAALAAA